MNAKRRSVVSFKNLSTQMQEEIKSKYPTGYQEAMIRVDKGPGDFFYAIPFETDEISYLVKIDVKIDTKVEEEEDKDFYDEDEIKGADELADANDDDDND